MGVFINIFLVLSIFFQTSEEWKLVKNTNEIKVFTRRLKGELFDEVKIVAKVNTTLMQATAALEDINGQVEWVYATEKVKFLESSKNGHIIYHYYMDMPFPAENRDAIIEYTRAQDPISKVVNTTSRNIRNNDRLSKGYERIKEFQTKYTLKPVSEGQIEITYLLKADPGMSLPAWLINMFTTKGPYKSMSALVNNLEKGTYASAIVVGIEN